ncbi:4a-hydroxytetrahydrobiopterin dehydratase [Salisaeta longa]|uniref:4a-hydroxytetrahydrobiopterin dehydratase n=1 Tax=Salisaeta longa TaxID=503170 RepID=UPI0003B39D53|nr:4a-hydroxytetrahydrobiopterin dehydratase [Salisaeta longa]
MPNATPLSDADLQDALAGLDGWSHTDDQLVKSFTFTDFRAAISFIVRLSFYAEELNHHPELTNVYNEVTVALTTHDAGNVVTDLDVQLAEAIEEFAWA